MKKIKVGFIGLGNMGGPMARNIMKSGYPLSVLDIKKDLTRPFAQEGADVVETPQAIGEKCDIVLTSLPTQAASEKVWFGSKGVLAGVKPNCIFVELSTVHPDLVKRLDREASQKKVGVIDAGVSGGVKKAEDGTLTIMVGGKKEAFEMACPVLKVIGKTIYHVGEIGAGMIVKLINNAIGHINVAAFIECISVGLKAGIDINTLYEVISQGTGSSKQFETRFKDKVMKANYSPGMKLDLVYKDSALMQELAGKLSMPIFLTSVAHQVFEMGMAKGYADMDYAILMKIWDDFRSRN